VSDPKDTPQEPENLPEVVDAQEAAPETTPQEPAGHPHEDQHTPLSARVLKILFLLAVGCGIALWGAPKLAPMLPQGMAPVAEFLMPGQFEAKSDVAALRREMTEKLAALEARPTGDVTQADVDKALSALSEKYNAELAALKDQISATDSQEIEARLAKVESRIEGITAELAAMNERLALQITENGTALSEEAAAKLSGYQAVIDGLKAQIDDLAARNGALSQRIDEVAAAASRRVQEAQNDATEKVATTAASKLLTDIGSALETGRPFQGALEGLSDLAGIEAPEELAVIAENGTPGLADLRSRFGDVAYAALRAETQAESGNGVVGKLGAFLRAQVGTRSLSRQEGNSTDAILSRIEDDLSRGHLAQALAEAEALSDAPKAAMKDWLASLARLSAARSAMKELAQSLGATQ
jgi:hypothetical protein